MESFRNKVKEKMGVEFEEKIFRATIKNMMQDMYGVSASNDLSCYIAASSMPFFQLYKERCAISLLNPDPNLIEMDELDRIAVRFPHLLDQAKVSQTHCEDKLVEYLGQECAKCSSKGFKGDDARRTKSMEIQIRSADEPATIIHICLRPECQFTWNEN